VSGGAGGRAWGLSQCAGLQGLLQTMARVLFTHVYCRA
jgi:hypothetical protein